MADWLDLNARARRSKVAEALPVVLGRLEARVTTPGLATMVLDHLGQPATTANIDNVGRVLVSLAPDTAEARQDGDTFKAYGRVMRRWNWYPAGFKAGLTPGYQGTRLDPKDVADFQAWKAAGSPVACPVSAPPTLDEAWREVARRLAALEQYDLIDQLASLLLPSDADDLSDLIGD